MLQYDKEALLLKKVMCQKHDNELSRVYNDILNMCIESSECIPTTCPKNNLNSGGGRMKLPGWPKEVGHLSRRLYSGTDSGELWESLTRVTLQ